MAMTDNLKDIISRQKQVLSELEALDNSDFAKENAAFKNELEKAKSDRLSAEEKLKQLGDENTQLKNTLYEQIYNEKLAIVNLSIQKLDIYFKSSVDGEQNRLTSLENDIKHRIDTMADVLKRNNVDIHDDIYAKLDELSYLLNEKVTIARAEFNKQSGAFSENEKAEFESLKNEHITDNMIKENSKKNNWESFVGLNIINKLGIFLIIIGVIVASQYTYFNLPDMLKGIMMFGLGSVMLITGEILNRKKPNIFSLGITAGGVSILYVALGLSYFGLKILDMYPAITLCLLITAVAFVLSLRYNAQVVLAFSLVGGYIPMLAIGANKTMLYGAMIYFVVLNLFALLISFKKKWSISTYIGLCLNIAGTIYIVNCALPYNRIQHAFGLNTIITISYVLFAFLIYSLIPIINTYTQKLKFKKSDIVLLGINTFFSSIIIYITFSLFALNAYYGLLAIIFAIIYLALGKFVEIKFSGDMNTRALFYLTGFAFVVLIVPFQFGKSWLTLGWLAEGVALTTYGILKIEKDFKKIGYAICGLCLGAFLIVDIFMQTRFLFPYKYLAITIGSVVILGSHIYKKSLSTTFEKAYKYLAIINLWIYSIYVITVQLQSILHFDKLNTSYICNALAIVVTFLVSFVAPRIKILCDKGVKGISVGIYIIGILWLASINIFASPLKYSFSNAPLLYTILGTTILLVISLLSILALYDLMKCIVMERKLSIEWFPLVVSGYFVLILTQNLITQYHLSFTNFAISIIYVITSFVWIIIGFVKRYSFLRKFGLGLSILAVIKLFLIDLGGLTQGFQIVSYFALGITLVAISFVYQYFNKRLEFTVNVKEDN